MLFKYSFFSLLAEYKARKEEIHARLRGEPIENYDKGNKDDTGLVMGMSMAVFLVMILISAVFWIWALVVLIKYWSLLPVWAQVIGCLGLFTNFSVATLVVVYIGKGAHKGSRMCGGRRR